MRGASTGRRREERLDEAPNDCFSALEGFIGVNLADPLRLEQVLANLLDNAAKFSPPGTAIEVHAWQPDAATAHLEVRDHGLGIAPEHRGRIFGRFFQAHAAEYRSGLGLGLHIARQLAELHGGSIAAEFPEDGGTRFVVSLPIGDSAPGDGAD